MRNHSLFLTAFVAIQAAMACTASAAPEWRHAAQHDRKLYADVLLGDERGTYWDDRLPEGWAWLPDHREPAAGYFRLDQVEPKIVDGKVVFVISKWNFFGINRQHDFSLEQLVAKSKEIDASADVRFRESDDAVALRKRFASMSLKDAEKSLEDKKGELLPKIAEATLFVVRAKSGTVAAVWFERLGSIALVRVRILTPAADGKQSAERYEARSTDAVWGLDLSDGDRAQIEWTPGTATTDAILRPAAGVAVAPVGAAK